MAGSWDRLRMRLQPSSRPSLPAAVHTPERCVHASGRIGLLPDAKPVARPLSLLEWSSLSLSARQHHSSFQMLFSGHLPQALPDSPISPLSTSIRARTPLGLDIPPEMAVFPIGMSAVCAQGCLSPHPQCPVCCRRHSGNSTVPRQTPGGPSGVCSTDGGGLQD